MYDEDISGSINYITINIVKKILMMYLLLIKILYRGEI